MEVKTLCKQCKNFNHYGEDITTCELGRVKEFQTDGGLTTCEYWEAKIWPAKTSTR